MSEKQKAFSAGAILSGLLYVLVTGVVTWVGLKASEVPVLESNIAKLNKTLDRVEEFIKHHHEEKTEWMVWKTETMTKLKEYKKKLDRNDFEIEVVGIKCESNERKIAECKELMGGM